MFGYEPDVILPLIFAGLMGISILVYVILDGFDLGIGILSVFGTDDEKDTMIASIGPFWDANETWLVLSIGLLLVAFPIAHGIILTALYLPVFVLLVGLVLRGIAFDFRSKVSAQSKWMWNLLFFIGSVMSSLSQGYMLGIYVLGLDLSWASAGFAALVGLCLAASYGAVGAAWLIYKTEGQLQEKAVIWMRMCLLLTAAGIRFGPNLRQMVHDAGNLPAGSAAASDGRRLRRPLVPDSKAAPAGRFLCAGALFGDGDDLHARLRRARLLVLSLYRAGSADDLRSGKRSGKPDDHPRRHGHRATDHRRLHDPRLPHLPG
jgi:hypothetical protein